jgi:uncharacterized protein (TIGR03086 family)
MTDDATELPVFPTTAPAVFCDPDATRALFGDVLGRLAEVVDLDDDQLSLPTPCAQYDAGQLRSHVLGWLGFFAAALCDPAATSPRPDPEGLELVVGDPASALVRRNLEQIQQAIADDAAGQMVTMMSSRMAGDGVLGMALGEYIVHGWDLARATGRPYSAPDAAVAPAHEFLLGMVAPEYRGPDTGFFDVEVEVPAGAPALDRLLGFAGRDPAWVRPT